MFKSFLVLTAVASLGLVAGCSNNKACCDDAAAAAKSADAKVAVINTMCPVGGDDFGSKERPTDLARTFNGQAIGFCCEGCVKQFDKMSDEKKTAVLAAATANKPM